MAPDSLDPPRTPTRAVSSEPCLARRDSMEDADSSVTRKRPRLDSGARTYRSMSADKVVVGGGGDGGHDDPPSLPPHRRSLEPARLRTPSPPPQQLPSIHRTPSRVTINVRTPARSSPNANSTAAPEPASAGPPPEAESSLAVDMEKDMEQEANTGGNGSRAISISSSAQSPEIEVAEVEDMDQDPNETRWTSVVNITGTDGTLQTLLDAFPLLERYSSLRDSVSHIAQIFEKGKRIPTGRSFIGEADRTRGND